MAKKGKPLRVGRKVAITRYWSTV